MASAAVMATFLAKLQENWTATPIVELNTGGDAPSDNTPFLEYQFPISNEDMISFGAPSSNTFRETGACRIILSIPIGSGLGDWPEKIDALRAVLRGQFFDGIVTWGASPPAINDQSDDGGYFELSFAVPYQFDIYG